MTVKNKKPIASPQALDDLLKDIGQAWDIAMKKTTTLSKAAPGAEDDDSDAPEAPQDQQEAPAAPGPEGAGAPPAEGQDPGMGGAPGAGAPGQDPSMGGAPGAEGAGMPGADGAGAPGAEGAPGQEGAGAPGQDPDQQLEQEGQAGQDGELSDEELQQIYGAMDPQELERHYMVLRGILRDQYQKAEAGTEDKKDEDQSAKDMDKCGDMSKSEKGNSENQALKAEVAELKKSIDGLLKATKILSQPVRKAATTEIEFINKSEGGSNSTVPAEVLNLSKAEIKDKLNTLCKTNMTLTKSERDLANRYILTGSNESEVLKLIGAKK